MKLVPLRSGVDNAFDVLFNVAKISPQKAMLVDEMRQRVKIMDKLEAAKDQAHVLLEDAEHAVLRAAIEAFPWAMATRDVLGIIDDVLEAKAPPAPETPKPPAAEKADTPAAG